MLRTAPSSSAIRAAITVIAILAAGLATSATAQTLRTWDGSSSTAWKTAGNWGSNKIADTNREVAVFDSNWSTTTNSPTISTNNVTVGGIRIGSTVPATNINIGGTTGVLSIDTSGWSGTYGIDNQSTRSETIGAELSLVNSQTWRNSNASGGNLTISNTVAVGTNTLTVSNTNAASSITLSNLVTGTGALAVSGAGTVTISNSSFNFGGGISVNSGILEFSGTTPAVTGSLTLASGSTLRLSGASLTVGTIHITGNSVIDFGSSSASILNATNFTIDPGVTLVSIVNWANSSDYFYSTNWTSATLGTRGQGPELQMTFSGYSNSATAWLAYDHQITPAPEPGTYGLIFSGLATVLVALRRRLSETKRSA